MADYLRIARAALAGVSVEPKSERPTDSPTSAEAAEIEAGPKGVACADWKAAALNRLFQEQGVTGQPGRITAATVRHGGRKAGRIGPHAR